MRILFVCVEMAPFAKVGGLADVAAALPKDLRRLGHDVRVVMPGYALTDKLDSSVAIDEITLSMNPFWSESATIRMADADGVPVYFIDHERFFREATSSATIYLPGIEQYLFFTQAAVELPGALDWQPDVVHCNDWHTGLVPVLMREKLGPRFGRVGCLFTIHNLAYQGEFGPEVLDSIGLPGALFEPDRLETWGRLNFLKSGCVYSDHVNTVSPTYAREIQTPEFGCTLHGLMAHLAGAGRLHGILNGIDLQTFDPASDPHLPENYSPANFAGKMRCRSALLDEAGLEAKCGELIAGVVTRISSQKGLNLLIDAFEHLAALPIRFVIQGLGEAHLISRIRELESQFPAHLRFFERFDEDLARRIYAGSDLFAMPSLFEPCGLGQMIAMRYGTLPLVRSTGGLKDTVTEGKNGFAFDDPTSDSLLAGFQRAADTYRRPHVWRKLVRRALDENHGWAASALKYAELYGSMARARERKPA